MTLSKLISKNGLIDRMTATSATLVTKDTVNNVECVAGVTSVAVATLTELEKQQLTVFVEECCKSLPVNAQQVIEHLLSIDDELDIINGLISQDILRLHIEVWIKGGICHISGKIPN